METQTDFRNRIEFENMAQSLAAREPRCPSCGGRRIEKRIAPERRWLCTDAFHKVSAPTTSDPLRMTPEEMAAYKED